MPTGIPRKTREPGTVVVKAGRRKPGRPKGRRNNKTLIKQAELQAMALKCRGYLTCELEHVVKVLVDKAKDGDMTAIKLILERTMPAHRAVDDREVGGGHHIQINITSGDTRETVVDTVAHPDGHSVDTEEVTIHAVDSQSSTPGPDADQSAHREGGSGPQGGEVHAEHGGQEGERTH